MSLTRARLQRMKEAELRKEVLIPLFTAMGFRDVRHHHGGLGEQGKDIVMWLEGPFGDREYYAVVVKATAISGQAQGSGSAGEVFVQVSQALGSKFVDPSDLSERLATKCIVVTAQSIRKEAAVSIRSALGAKADERAVRFIDGDELWGLLSRYTPERTVGEHLQLASTVLENASEHHRVIAHLSNGTVQLGVEDKHSRANEVEPLEVKAVFEFPADQAGRTAMAAMESHARRGTPVTIPGEFITTCELPALLKPFVEGPVQWLALGPAKTTEVFEASVVVRNADGNEARLSGVRFHVVRRGTDEVVVSNQGQNVPWIFEWTLNRVEKRARVRSTFRAQGNVKREYEVAHFQRCLSLGGALSVSNEETGIQLVSIEVRPGVVPEPAVPWIRFVDALLLLQQRSGVVVSIPSDVPVQDADEIIETAEQIRAGVWQRQFSGAVMRLDPADCPEVLKHLDPVRSNRIVIVREEAFEVFGVELPLGVVVRAMTHVTMTDECRRRLSSRDPAGEPDIALRPFDERSTEIVAFTRWLDGRQLDELRTRLPGVDFDSQGKAQAT